jgi:hypothetical protein
MHCGRRPIDSDRFWGGYMICFLQEMSKPLLDSELRVMSEIRTGIEAKARRVQIRKAGWTGNETSNVDVKVPASCKECALGGSI